MENLSYKVKGLTKGVEPDTVVNEFRRLQNLHGILTPEVIVTEASKKKSPLHLVFEWDNDKAAHNYRLQQARVLLNNIQVTVVSDGEPMEIAVYEVTTRGEGYKSIDTFTPDDVAFIRNNTISQLSCIKRKLALYKEFEKATKLINQAIEVLN